MSLFESILGFNNEFEFLSNFYPASIEYEGIIYPTVEHAYQAAKTMNLTHRSNIAKLKYAGQAKKAGRKLAIRDDWEDVKVSVMEYLLRQKFSYEDLKSKLIATEDRYIEETNHWNDTFWGVCNGKGQNILGKLLMKIRNEIMPT